MPSAGRQRPALSGIIVSIAAARGARWPPLATAPLHLLPEGRLMTIEHEKVVTVHYIMPERAVGNHPGHMRRRERLGGLLSYYHREAA